MGDDEVREAGIEVRFEDGGTGELYPHLYGAISPALVRDVLPAGVDAGGRLRF